MKEIYTLADLQNWSAATAGENPPVRLSVFGDPVAHSASPPMHNAALEKCGIAARYCRLHIRPDELREALRLLVANDFIGTNLTIPHKVAALGLVDADEHARKIGVVNTVAIRDGKLLGFNTDGPGLVRAVREELGVELRDLRVMVLGAAGGAGRAISMQCGIENCQRIVLVNRGKEKADALKTEMYRMFPKIAAHIHVGFWSEASFKKQLAETDLLINCTPIGMKPGDDLLLPTGCLAKLRFVYDTIYTANKTKLQLTAEAAGARSANGLSMLLHQGALAFEIWFNRAAPVDVMREALLNFARNL